MARKFQNIAIGYAIVTTFDSVPCRIGAGLTQCTFYQLETKGNPAE